MNRSKSHLGRANVRRCQCKIWQETWICFRKVRTVKHVSLLSQCCKMAAETDPLQIQIQIQENQTFEEEKHCCGYCRRSLHIRGLIFSIILWGLFIYTTYSYATRKGDFENSQLQLLFWVYIIYLIEARFSRTWRYLKNMKTSEGEDFGKYVERIKKEVPLISMTCECFHYEIRVRSVTEYYTEYVNGQSVQRTRIRLETYQERVVTYNGLEMFQYTQCSDDSRFLSDEMSLHNAVRIDLLKSWVPADSRTMTAYHRQYEKFKRKHQRRDKHFVSFQNFHINGFKSSMSSVAQQKWYLNWRMYGVITFCCSSIFYRYWFDRYSVKAKFEFKKIIKLQNLSSNSSCFIYRLNLNPMFMYLHWENYNQDQ